MTGTVDNKGRALVQITIRHPHSAAGLVLEAWIDTGFTGELVLQPAQVTALGLPLSASVVRVLADGSRAVVATHSCAVEWFGSLRLVNALVSPGRFPLIGIRLVEDLVLTIDYPARTVTLLPSATP